MGLRTKIPRPVRASNLIPGPSSTELGIFLGYERAGTPGLIGAGASFIAPAFLMVLALAWAYGRFGALPQTGWVLGMMDEADVRLSRRTISPPRTRTPRWIP